MASDQLRVIFFPLFIAGHTIPTVELARLFARQGVDVIIVTIAANAVVFQEAIDGDCNAGHCIRFHILDGLPEVIERFNKVTFMEQVVGLSQCAKFLQRPFELLLQAELAVETDVILLPGLPHKIEMLRSQLIDKKSDLFNGIGESWKKTYGVIMNSFHELEPSYEELFKTSMKIKTWSVGPFSLWFNRDMEKNSVLYVSFGSVTKFPATQLIEIAHALENSGHPFIWVVRKKEEEEYEDVFPAGFEERMKESKRGFIVKNWAPQLVILDHLATGGMVTHCGWNSTLEGITAGLPMITWPLFGEQFFNEKLVTDVLRIGVGVGVKQWSLDWSEAGRKEVVKREQIEKAVALLMGSGQEAVEMRKQAGMLAAAARKAVESGGSSNANLLALINELKSVKIQIVV
ncbi:hypothetical protein UlMin_037302 [Ulmus minor]